MIELSRTQDEECGDGTTSVIILGAYQFRSPLILPSNFFLSLPSFLLLYHDNDTLFLAGEILAQSLSQLERDIHPVVIISAYTKALHEALDIVQKISTPINTSDDEEMLALIKTSIGTKFVVRWSGLMCELALKAVRIVAQDESGVGVGGGGIKTVDIKRYARVEKVPGGEIEESKVLRGIMLNKDVTHPHMRRRILRPRIVLLDCPLEYKKGESQTNMEFSKEGDWKRAQEIEEEQVKEMVRLVLEFKPDLVITEKGISGAFSSSILVESTEDLSVSLRYGSRGLRQSQSVVHSSCT
jgi:T-complex protein 1 subunit gamma